MSKLKEKRSEQFRWQWENNRPAFLTWLLLRLIVLAVLIRSVMLGYWENAFICLLVLFLFLLPSLLEKRLGVSFPSGLQIVILIHIFACEILGELGCYYVKYPHWDTITHTVWAFSARPSATRWWIFSTARTPHHLSPAFLAVVAFCFSMTIGVLWEFFEFAADQLLLLDMQKDTVITRFSSVLLDATSSNIPIQVNNIADVAVNGESLGLNGYLDIGLFDTMEDLFVNSIGALVFSLIGYFRTKSENAKRIAESFIPRPAAELTRKETS